MEEALRERNTISVMHNNLSTGVFLMDSNSLVQGSYSKVLEDILSVKDLEGKSFVELLSKSLTEKEQGSLADYFEMLFTRAYDETMLADINPIHEIKYTSITTGEEKILQCTFSLIDRGGGVLNILSIIEDITLERQLQKQLNKEEDRSQAEMRSLFEVVQVEPKVFADFIEDLDYEFEKINESLKHQEMSAYAVLIEVYQSVHAMKANAIILGFSNFANKLQDLESEIKNICEKEKIPFDDVLHVTFAIDKIMDEKERFGIAFDKIRTFKIGDMEQQTQGVLVETLKRAMDKASLDLGKKVSLIVKSIDERALEGAHRRIIRDVLVQLVRNAVSHGVELPHERVAAGKSETGTIRITIACRANTIHAVIKDDGKGFDFDEIKAKAINLHLLKKGESKVTKQDLIKIAFSPGFSTAKVTSLHAGRGIGLNLVRDRIMAVKGTIKLQSEDGKGSVFTITLPMELAQTSIENQKVTKFA